MGLDNEQIYEIEFLQPTAKLKQPDDEEMKESEKKESASNFKFLLAKSDLDLLIYRGIIQGVFTHLSTNSSQTDNVIQQDMKLLMKIQRGEIDFEDFKVTDEQI